MVLFTFEYVALNYKKKIKFEDELRVAETMAQTIRGGKLIKIGSNCNVGIIGCFLSPRSPDKDQIIVILKRNKLITESSKKYIDIINKRELSRSRRTVATFSFGRNNAVSEAFSRGMRFRTDMLFNGSICGAQRDKNGDPDFGAPCAFDAVREDLARRPLRGVPDGRPFLEVRRDVAR